MKELTGRKWLKTIAIIVVAVFVICSLLTYIVDPFFQYRTRDNQYIISGAYCAAGLIKNYDYDTIVIGSSMTQNFNMDLFRKYLSCSPLHVGVGGMTAQDTVDYTLLADSVGKADTYYICIDIANFRHFEERKTTDYLMKDDILSRMQYATSFESLFRFMPVDIALTAITATGHSLPASYENRVKIDKLEYWGDKSTYGETKVIKGWKTGANSVSSVDTTNLYEIMIEGIDSFFSQLNLNNADYNFFFPPYSSLYWSDAQDDGYFDTYMDVKEYFIKSAAERGATVYDFQGAELTADLNNYRDTTHYSPDINDWMTECFSKKDYIVTPDNYSHFKEQMVSNTEEFRSDHAYLFE